MTARRAAALALAVVVVAVTIQYGGALFGGVYHFEDAADSYYPGHEMTRRALKEGTLPLWERGSWSGWPAVVDPYNGIFYPPNVLYYLLGGARGLGYVMALHAIFAALGLYCFLRRRGLSRPAALVGGLAYALSSFMVVRLRHPVFVQMTAWIPWIMWVVDRWVTERRLRILILLAAAGGLSILVGALSLEILAALPVLAYLAVRLASSWRDAEPGRRRRLVVTDLVGLSLAAVVGFALAAAQVFPSLAHLPESPRALGTSYEFSSTYAWPNLRYALTLIVPDLFSNNMRGRYLGVFNYWEMAGYYVGVVTWMLAPFAFLWRAPTGERRRRVELVVLGLLALVGMGAALGDAGPVHRLLYHGLPLYATLRCPTRALFIAVLVVPILAAHGVDALLTQAASAPRRGRVILALVVTLLVAAAGVSLLATLPAGQAAPRAGAQRLLLLGLLAGAGLVVAALRVVPPRVIAASLVVLVAADLLWQNAGYLKPEPPSFPAGTERYQALEWVREHGRGWRFVNDGHGPFRLHNVGLTYGGLENASGYDSVPIWRYRNYLYIMNRGRPYPHRQLRDDLAAAGIVNFNSRLLDALSVRYVISFRNLGPPRFKEVFRPAGKPTLAWAEPHWDRRLRVFENQGVLPRAFVVYRAQTVADGDAAAQAISARRFDPGTVAILERPPDPAPEPGLPGAPSYTPAQLRRHERYRVVVEATLERPGVLVFAEVYYPGWSATVDGRPAPLLRADYALRAVALPAGQHRVELRYRSRPAVTGIAVSLGALVLLLGATGLGWYRRRRAPA